MRKLSAVLVLIGALALIVAGCGGGSDNGGGAATSGTATGTSTGQDTNAKKGGNLTVMSLGDVDSLDPGYWYYQYDYMVLEQTTQRHLYGWEPDKKQPSPDLAEGLPEASNGGKTLTIKIKPGIMYSPPLADREVTSADFKYAIERAFLPQVANAYVYSYFSEIKGVKDYTDGKAKEITGIETPDEHTLVLQLERPLGVLSTGQALALSITVPVPKDYAEQYDKGKTSTYGQHQVFTGPYMIKNDGNGKLTGYVAGKRIDLVRNPSWKADTDYRPAYLDTITVLGGNDAKLASEKILSGQSMVSGDFAAPPTAVLKSALQRNKDQLDIAPSGSIRFISLNTTVKPLDNINFRKAILAVTNRNALRLTRGGETVGPIATHYIPPGIPGFEESGGNAGPAADFTKNADGDVQLAMEYMKKAGYPSGKYTGPPLLMVGDNDAPANKTGEAFQSQLEQIGIKVTYRQVEHATMISKFCGVPDAKVAICPNLGWGKDFFDGQSMIDPIFNGKNIVPANNVNYSQVNDPEINKMIVDAEGIDGADQRAQAWADINKKLVEGAYMVPWLWDNQINIRSSNVNVQRNEFSSSWDLSFASLK